MPRPPKHRCISAKPVASLFKPSGIPSRNLGCRTLALDGFEVLRLVDYEGMDQDTAADRLGVSRPTVTRILQRARNTIADVLVNGLALVIEGGQVIHRSEIQDAFLTGKGGQQARKERDDMFDEDRANNNPADEGDNESQPSDEGRGQGRGRGMGRGQGKGQGKGRGQGRRRGQCSDASQQGQGSGRGQGRGSGQGRGHGRGRMNDGS